MSGGYGYGGGGVADGVTRCGDADVATEGCLGVGGYLVVPVAFGELEASRKTQPEVYGTQGVADGCHLDRRRLPLAEGLLIACDVDVTAGEVGTMEFYMHRILLLT